MDRIDEAIAKARAFCGGECGDCEAAMESLAESLPADPKRKDGRGSGPGLHDYWYYEGEVLDPTAAQFTDYCTGRTHHAKRIGEAELVRAGLDRAVKTGRFTRQQHELFKSMIPKR
jgi:hypothetical protein